MNSSKTEVINILKSYLNKQYNYSLNCDIDELYNLSNALGITSIIGYTLNKCSIKNDKFENSIYKSLNKYERIINARNELDKLLNNKYQYLYIKGYTISKYYDEPYIRYSSDMDIIVEEEKYDEICKLLLKHNYKIKRRDKQEITLKSPNNITIDLHRYYTLDNDKFEEIFGNCFNETHELDINYNYVFNLAHCLKHLKSGILKYRFFIDLYYLRDLIDVKKTNELLVKTNLDTFNKNVNSYLDCILGKKEYSKNDLKIEEFIFSCANDMGIRNRIAINSYGKSKFSYLLSRVFIPYDLISEEYPILQKYKVLLPVYYVKRIIRISTGIRKDYAINEVRNNGSINSEEIKEMHEFIDNIVGLDS